jgi:hypothetical protein
MAFTPKRKQPEFASLKNILSQMKGKKDDALYKTLQFLIERLTNFQIAVNGDVIDVNNSINESNTEINLRADRARSYLTTLDETLYLPNSVRLLAGPGVAFDDTIPNQRTVSASGGYAPMATGAEPLEIMSDGAGHVLMVGFNV